MNAVVAVMLSPHRQYVLLVERIDDIKHGATIVLPGKAGEGSNER
jgi:ABC-type metal ion transport system substrate-binding protein